MRSWLKWAGHVERMEEERLMKKAVALRMEGRRRGRLMGDWRTASPQTTGIMRRATTLQIV